MADPHASAAQEAPPLAAKIGLWVGPILALAVFFLLPHGSGGLAHAARACGGVATLMAVWWMSEALPLEATALLPLVLLPLTGVYSPQIAPGDVVEVKPWNNAAGIVEQIRAGEALVHAQPPLAAENPAFAQWLPLKELSKDSPFKRAATPFADPSIFMFLGGFMIALAIEKWGLHRRLALLTLLAVGTSPSRLVGGFLLATGFVSMWISNTATAVMMLPIGLSVVHLLTVPRDSVAGGPPRSVGLHSTDAANFATSLLLAIAYAASLGGFATLIGTPPNVYFAGYMRGRGLPIDFGRWMLFAAPLSLSYLCIAWLLLTKLLFPVRLTQIAGGHALIQEEYRKLGKVSRGEWTVLAVFLATATLWIARDPLAKWTWFAGHVPIIKSVDDSLIAMTGAVALFLIPVDPERHVFALDWRTALKLPWGVLLLFGGGLSLAAALGDSGLARWIGQQVGVLGKLPTYWQIVLIVALIVFSGELTSNLAAVVALMPILFEVAAGMKVDPLLLCVPAVVAASCGFMLPVATPPNAIVFGAGHIKLGQMVRAGFLLDLVAVVLIPLFTYLFGGAVLGIKF